MKSLVLKFGGAAVEASENFSRVADIIADRRREYPRVVIVVSAMRGMTDQLIRLARQVNPAPPQREYDMLVTVGERISISLLAMALAAKGVEAVSFTGSQSGIITTSKHTDAQIVDVRPHRLLKCLEKGKIAIVAGFQGVSQEGEITTLGRGGSDTTAVALGLALQAEKVEFFKDVDGIFEADPKVYPGAKGHSQLSYAVALEIIERGSKVLHSRCLRLAEKNALPLHVRSFVRVSCPGTRISDSGQRRLEKPLYE